MMTVLTSAKPFTGSVAALQRKSFANWHRVDPAAEIVLFGACKGAEKVCGELNVRQVTDMETSETGVPYFDSVARWARENARYDVQVYANADILLPPNFCKYVAKVPSGPFLMIGQRVDLKKDAVFDPDDFYEQLKRVLRTRQAEVHRPSGMDFFVFRRGMWQDLKPLIVGRGGYDSALVAYCLRKGIPVIDASFAFPVVHQWHDYSHVKDGRQQAHYGAEAQFNFETHGLRGFGPNCLDADLMMTRNGEIAPNTRKSRLRKLEIGWYYKRGLKWCPRFNQVWNVFTRGGARIKQPSWIDAAGRACMECGK